MDKQISDIETRLAALRAEMDKRGLSGFVVPLTDEHQSEYVPEYAQRLAWISGFGGSAGMAVIMADRAAIFVDGRYTIQVAAEVDAAVYDIQHLIDNPPLEWIKKNASEGDLIGYDPFLHTIGWVQKWSEGLGPFGISLKACDGNPIDAAWPDQPGEPMSMAALHDVAFAGESAAEKRTSVASVLTEKGADACVLTSLDSIAWAFNIRGADISHMPVAMSFALLQADGTADLFINPEKMSADVQAGLGNAVRVQAKSKFLAALDDLGGAGKAVLVDPDTASAAVFDALKSAGATVIKGSDPCQLPKAKKNATEIAGTRNAHIRDGAAVTRFLHWLSENAASGDYDEISAAAKLLEFRKQDPEFRDSSFDTISASAANGALCHYRVSEETNLPLEAGQLYLVDSGAQYFDGTTDITRTVAVGAAGEEERTRFTLVLQGHIALATAVFPKGTTGSELDSFARRPLWEAGLDYDHGTGHGVGVYLGVHEGPGRIAKVGNSIDLEPGMIFSNEPGYYKEGAYGIRIENLVVVESRDMESERPMMGFDELTLAPICRDLIDAGMLDEKERAWLDAYHARVRETLSPLLPDDVAEWLAGQTAAI